MKKTNSAEGSEEGETEQQRLVSQYLNLKMNSEPHQLANESQEEQTEQQRILSNFRIMAVDPNLTSAREGERNLSSTEHGHLRYLILPSKLNFLPESSSCESKIMTGDDSDKEGSPNQDHTKKDFSFMYSMVEEMGIEPFLKDAKRQRKMIANKFNDLHERGFNEFDLLRFKKVASLIGPKKEERRSQAMDV